MSLPLGSVTVALGFPSPAEDFEEARIDRNPILIRNPPATCLYRAQGTSMIDAGICDGDIVIAIWEGNQPTCKILQTRHDHLELHGCNSHCPPIHLSAEIEVEIFTVTGIVRPLLGKGRHAHL